MKRGNPIPPQEEEIQSLKNYRVIYYIGDAQYLHTTTVRGRCIEEAELEVREYLRGLAGRGLWKYEILTHIKDGEFNTKTDR